MNIVLKQRNWPFLVYKNARNDIRYTILSVKSPEKVCPIPRDFTPVWGCECWKDLKGLLQHAEQGFAQNKV